MSRAKKQLKARRRRERAGHGTKARGGIRLLDSPPPYLANLTYTVSKEPIHLPKEAEPRLWRALDDDERSRIHEQVKSDPRQAVENLEPLLQKFPASPMLLNWLAAAYSNLGHEDKADDLVRLNYERNPNYLFASARTTPKSFSPAANSIA